MGVHVAGQGGFGNQSRRAGDGAGQVQQRIAAALDGGQQVQAGDEELAADVRIDAGVAAWTAATPMGEPEPSSLPSSRPE